MKFRPCIDIHNGKVKQIVGGSLQDEGNQACENFVSGQNAAFYADLYYGDRLTGGHVILLNSADSEYYQQTKEQAFEALNRHPGMLQAGGGITAENAAEFLDAGASHVIVTSYVFRDGEINRDNLRRISEAAGAEHLVLDLSCRKKPDGYYIVTDRWQKFTNVRLSHEVMDELAGYCDEFLIHAVDAEGKVKGPELELAELLGSWGKKPMTYAGGISCFEDLKNLEKCGKGRLDVTIGSALDLFGGSMPYRKVIEFCESLQKIH